MGWAFFGDYWGGVRLAGARLLVLFAILVVSAGLHYVACALGPLLGLLSLGLHALVWALRWVATWGSKRVVRNAGQKRRHELSLVGPAVANHPDTAFLRSAKTMVGEDPPRAVLCLI